MAITVYNIYIYKTLNGTVSILFPTLFGVATLQGFKKDVEVHT